MASRRFFGLMGVASAVSLTRGFAIAALLDPASFGTYAVVVASGAFGSTLISAGRVEQTMKSYPRLWVNGAHGEVVARSDATAGLLIRRSAILAAAIALAATTLPAQADWLWLALGAVVVAAATAAVSLYASAHRATLDLPSMGAVTLQRASLSISLGCTGALLFSWPGAVAGEIIAAWSGMMLSRRKTVALARAGEAALAPAQALAASNDPAGGRWLFASTLAASGPAYLDRPFVAALWGPAAAGSYAFLMLFVTCANVVVGIAAQKVGPQFIRMAHAQEPVRQLVCLATRWIGVCLASTLIGLALAGFSLLKWPLNGLGNEYGVQGPLLAAIAILCSFQVSVFLEWLLISLDRERDVFLASATHIVVACAAAWFTHWLGGTMMTLLFGLAAAKFFQIVVQSIAIRSVSTASR